MPASPSGGSDSDDEEYDECPLCALDVRPEAYGVTPSGSNTIRQIMLTEATNYGLIPDRLLFKKVACVYKRLVYDPLVSAGKPATLWTPKDVQHHFTRCVSLLPRRKVVTSIRSLERIERHIRTKELFDTDDVTGSRSICPKALDCFLKWSSGSMELPPPCCRTPEVSKFATTVIGS